MLFILSMMKPHFFILLMLHLIAQIAILSCLIVLFLPLLVCLFFYVTVLLTLFFCVSLLLCAGITNTLCYDCDEQVIPGKDNRAIESLCWVNQRLFSAGLNGEVTEYDLVNLKPKYTVAAYGGPTWTIGSNNQGTMLAVSEDDMDIVFTLTLYHVEVLNLLWCCLFIE